MSVTEAVPEESRKGKECLIAPDMANSTCCCKDYEVPLTSLLPRETALITGLPDNDLLPFLGLRPGKSICFVAKQRFNGPLIVEVDGRCVAISCSIASRINVGKSSLGLNPVFNNA